MTVVRIQLLTRQTPLLQAKLQPIPGIVARKESLGKTGDLGGSSVVSRQSILPSATTALVAFTKSQEEAEVFPSTSELKQTGLT